MNTYFVAENGEVRGPYTQRQIVVMWGNGGLQADAQICEQGTEDWLPAMMMIEEWEQPKREKEKADKSSHERLLRNRGQYEREKKSAVVALILSLVLPFGGSVYSGQIVAGLVAAMLTIILFIGFFPLGIILWLLGIFDAPRAVRLFNEKLATSLGV